MELPSGVSATPGPWEIVVGSRGTNAYIYPQSPKPRPLIAEIPLGVLVDGKAERKANAQLIVAAPDLLAVAIKARDELEQYTARWAVELTAKLDKAIGKAEGS